jgi:hypothetical protein
MGTSYTVMVTIAYGDLVDVGKYPNDFAWDTALSLVNAVSINISFASIFA